MFNRDNPSHTPTFHDISTYIHNPLWDDFYAYMQETYHTKAHFDFSKCSYEYGWNVKLKKGSKTMCTIYPRVGYFIIMIVIGKKEKDIFENTLDSFCQDIQNIYHETKEGNGQRWLMIELEDNNKRYKDVKKILSIK